MALPIQVTTRYLRDDPASDPLARISILLGGLIQSVNMNIEHPWFPSIKSFEINVLNDANIPVLILDAVIATMKAYGYVFSEEPVVSGSMPGYRNFPHEEEYSDLPDLATRSGY